ncbi:DUF397 domain-containing protein [Streptomyces sp. B1866]|uniref:DUF397 domain-containing protein n=1 Tax=Streptomyces sp. B1866 TaxID=3075431 RepID=UPI002891D6C9|nr:DUF397 domain-containing protein [Streptomyces sp. B1866]MDT3395493.1 DUF397 domain-containing protein [Streptomyces sp. B1866]
MDKAELYALDVEGLDWRKSSLTSDNGTCFELAALPGGGVAVRDSKNPANGHLCFTQVEWQAFKGGVLLGDFNHLDQTRRTAES